MRLVQLFYNSVSSELSSTSVWVEARWSFYRESLSPNGGNQGALPPGPPLLRRAFFFAGGGLSHLPLIQLFLNSFLSGLHVTLLRRISR